MEHMKKIIVSEVITTIALIVWICKFCYFGRDAKKMRSILIQETVAGIVLCVAASAVAYYKNNPVSYIGLILIVFMVVIVFVNNYQTYKRTKKKEKQK